MFVVDVLSGKIPVRLYIWSVSEDFEDFEDMPKIDSWDKISYINQPIEIHREEGKLYLLKVCKLFSPLITLNPFFICIASLYDRKG